VHSQKFWWKQNNLSDFYFNRVGDTKHDFIPLRSFTWTELHFKTHIETVFLKCYCDFCTSVVYSKRKTVSRIIRSEWEWLSCLLAACHNIYEGYWCDGLMDTTLAPLIPEECRCFKQ
jgi:hypothetical protein